MRSIGISHPCKLANPARDRCLVAAFTLVEFLVVIGIIGVLAAIGLPKLRSFGKSNATISATRQLLDDVALARALAISSRSDVYMIFVPPVNTLPVNFPIYLSSDTERRLATNLLLGQYTTYAMFAPRSVGDQPGRNNPRFLTSWKTLPDGTFIAAVKFDYRAIPPYPNGVAPFSNAGFQFPLATDVVCQLPYVGFDYQGRVFHLNGPSITSPHIYKSDEIIPLARGSIFYPRDANGALAAPFVADAQENPPNNSITLSNNIHIDWVTGHARVERQEIQ